MYTAGAYCVHTTQPCANDKLSNVDLTFALLGKQRNLESYSVKSIKITRNVHKLSSTGIQISRSEDINADCEACR